jgi:hypothetical protein
MKKKEFYKIPAKIIIEDDDVSSGSDNDDFGSFDQINKTIENLRIKTESFVENNQKNELFTKTTFNFENLILIENLYNRLLKDFQNRSFNIDSTVLTWFDFISLNYDIYDLEHLLDDKVLKRGVKRFFIAEIILFCISYMRDLSNDQVYNALKTSFFYLHQNYIIIMFLVVLRTRKDVLATNELAKKCKAKVDENIIWINNNTYKTILTNNNKTIFNILKTLISQLKMVYKDKPQELSNISLVFNYVRNIKAYNVETIKEKLYEKVSIGLFISIVNQK